MRSSGCKFKNKQEEVLLKEKKMQANNYIVAFVSAGSLNEQAKAVIDKLGGQRATEAY